MAPRTSLACILTGPSRSAPDSDFIFLDGTLNQVRVPQQRHGEGEGPAVATAGRWGPSRAFAYGAWRPAPSRSLDAVILLFCRAG